LINVVNKERGAVVALKRPVTVILSVAKNLGVERPISSAHPEPVEGSPHPLGPPLLERRGGGKRKRGCRPSLKLPVLNALLDLSLLRKEVPRENYPPPPLLITLQNDTVMLLFNNASFM
jgi:hypothetical protein